MKKDDIPPWKRPEPPIKRIFGAFWRLLTQFILGQILFLMFGAIYLYDPETWGHNESYVALLEITKLVMYTISVFLVVKFFDNQEPVSLGLKNRLASLQRFFLILLDFVVLSFSLGKP
ncbi:MAG: hypothetical protein ACOYY3_20025 [Chloroflexota bacterium]